MKQEAERIKNVSSARGTSMHKFLESYVTGVGYDDLTELGRQARPMAEKIIEIGLAPVEEYYGPKLRYTIRAYTQAKQTLSVIIMVWKLLLTSNKLTVRKRKNGSKIIICKLQHTPWPTTMSTAQIKQGVIMVCTPDLYYQEFKVEGPELKTLET